MDLFYSVCLVSHLGFFFCLFEQWGCHCFCQSCRSLFCAPWCQRSFQSPSRVSNFEALQEAGGRVHTSVVLLSESGRKTLQDVEWSGILYQRSFSAYLKVISTFFCFCRGPVCLSFLLWESHQQCVSGRFQQRVRCYGGLVPRLHLPGVCRTLCHPLVCPGVSSSHWQRASHDYMLRVERMWFCFQRWPFGVEFSQSANQKNTCSFCKTGICQHKGERTLRMQEETVPHFKSLHSTSVMCG